MHAFRAGWIAKECRAEISVAEWDALLGGQLASCASKVQDSCDIVYAPGGDNLRAPTRTPKGGIGEIVLGGMITVQSSEKWRLWSRSYYAIFTEQLHS